MIVLDTNVVSELVRERPAEGVLAWVDARPVDDLHLTAITVAELRYGVARLPHGRRKDALEGAVAALIDDDFDGRVLPFDRAAADRYGVIVAGRERSGRPISQADAQIAAVCDAREAALATRNVRDFSETGITVVDPWATG